jgi:FKBP-type peptidyl-prolyl cis-trans isomerase/outer membrane protein assembly factor BamB
MQAQDQFQVLTRSYNNQRTGANLSEKTLSPANVNAKQFGKLFMLPVDDQIYAGLLYATGVPIHGRKHNVVYAATVNNSVYAFDADTLGPPLWYRNFNEAGRPSRNTELGRACGNYNDFIGNIGIVGTPVIGPNHTMYFVTRTVEAGNTAQRLRAIDIATGADRPNSPQLIHATMAATGEDSVRSRLAFNAATANQRAALSYSDGTVYIAWASFCDTRPYHGWMMAYDATTLSQVGIFNATPNHNMGGIWMSGAGPAFDSSGNVYVSTGNGSYNGTSEFGESLVKLGKRHLQPLDFFAAANFNTLNEFDLDFGTQGPTMLPGTNRLIVGGKEGKVYLLDTANLGGVTAGDMQLSQVVQADDFSIRPTQSHHLHNAIPVWKGPRGLNMYVWGENDFLRAFRFDASTQTFLLPAVASADILPPMGMPSGMMTVSANGSEAGSGVVWATLPRAGDANQMTVPGNLYAFDAENLALLWSSTHPGDDTLNFAKGSPPIVANGKVYVASISNFVSVYGLKRPSPASQNLALNRTATGSAPCDPSQTPDKAFNGSAESGPTDKWCSSDPHPYLQVDMGANTNVGRFVVEHAGAGGDDFLLNTRDFNIQLSTDGKNWETAVTVWNNIQSITTHDIKPTSARYVRLNVVTPDQIAMNAANIYELQVFSALEPPPDATVLAARHLPTMPKKAALPPRSKVAVPSDVAAPGADAQTTTSGIAMKVLSPGSGTEQPAANDCVKVSFTAWERDGSVFSSSASTANTELICLNTAIVGIAEALKTMVVGEKRRIWVPADLTFTEGDHRHNNNQHRPEDEEIPPHKDLTFDVELLSILKAPATPADLLAPPDDAVKTASGLAFKVLKTGTGTTHPTVNSTVTVHFSGWTTKGKMFESTVMAGHSAEVLLSLAMAGWREGLPNLVVGDKARFWIPAALAYGVRPANRFNPGGDLVYDIELLAVHDPTVP